MNKAGKKLSIFILFLMLSLAATLPALALTPEESVRQAVMNHAEIQAMIHAFDASTEEREAAKSGYRPRVDLSANMGWDSLSGSGYLANDQLDYSRNGVYLLLTQMIYDGYQTKNLVHRLGHARVAKYYDLLAAMEKVALLAFRSHEDVVRYTEMVKLARENLRRHEEILNKITDRSKAGLDSPVDVDLVRGRLALARVNLMTEESNLHDAITQYYRAVGSFPSANLEMGYVSIFPAPHEEEDLRRVVSTNSRRLAAEENTYSSLHALEEQRGRDRPRLDLRAGYNLDDNTDRGRGRRDKAFVELALRYNITDGGHDAHTIRRYSHLYNQSKEMLRKTEEDIRQSLLIAINDCQAINRRLPDLELHMNTAAMTENAYRLQYDVGRRSLLDLLDAQNEAYQSKRSYRNTQFTLENAKATYLAETGGILPFFDVLRPDVPTPETLGVKHREIQGVTTE